MTVEDITAYFGFDRLKDVNVALALISEQKGARQINGKTINVTKAELKSKDEQAGSFVLLVVGKVAEKDFENEFAFDGFVKKPENYLMVKHAHAKWKEGVDYYAELDFDSFYRLKKIDAFTAENLSRMISFYSSNFNSTYMYPFTPEDIKKTIIENVQYAQNQLTFDLKYGGNSEAKKQISLSFDKNKYYERKIAINTDFVKGKYMRGIYENPSLFNGRIISYDQTKYAVTISEDQKYKDDRNNTLRLHLKVYSSSNGDLLLAEFDKTFTGFKPLKELKNDLEATLGDGLHEYMKNKFKNAPLGDVKNRIASSIGVWIQKVDFILKKSSTSLEWKKNSWGKNVLDGLSTSSMKDIYLDDVRFELISAKLSNDASNRKFLYITFQMTGANEVVFSDAVTFDMAIHIPSNQN